jgi:hypothetical protein
MPSPQLPSINAALSSTDLALIKQGLNNVVHECRTNFFNIYDGNEKGMNSSDEYILVYYQKREEKATELIKRIDEWQIQIQATPQSVAHNL